MRVENNSKFDSRMLWILVIRVTRVTGIDQNLLWFTENPKRQSLNERSCMAQKMLAHLKGFVRVASGKNNEDSFDTLCVEPTCFVAARATY